MSSSDFTPRFLTDFLKSGAILGISGANTPAGVSGASSTDAASHASVPDARLLLGIQRRSQPHSGASFYAPDFFLTDPSPWLHFETVLHISSHELLAQLETYLKSHPETEELSWKAAPREPFERAFAALQTEIQQGRLEKGVPFTFEIAQASMIGARLARALHAALEYSLNRPVVPYGFWSEEEGKLEGMLGCTPETLFRQDSGGIHTMALAGTRRHVDHDRLPLMDDPKERREHQLVLDSILQDLSPFGTLRAQPTFEAILPQLSHLKTLIDLRPTRPVLFEELVGALHPTPALGAFPRINGWDWLKQLEHWNDLNRARYGAPFGAVWRTPQGEERSLCVVAIRNIQWNNSRILLCAGCGVIAESQLEREWHELQGKLGAVKGILAL